MAENRIKLSCLDKKGTDGKRIYNYQRWLERLKHYTKRKYEVDIGPLIEVETKTGTHWNTEEGKIQQGFL